VKANATVTNAAKPTAAVAGDASSELNGARPTKEAPKIKMLACWQPAPRPRRAYPDCGGPRQLREQSPGGGTQGAGPWQLSEV